MKKNSVFWRLALALSGKQAASATPTDWRTGLPGVDAKIGIAQNSVRPRYCNPKEIEPYVGAVRAHQVATRGSIPGVYLHPRGK